MVGQKNCTPAVSEQIVLQSYNIC